jgi:hypothetical protein
VSPVLAQMHSNAIRPRINAKGGGRHRIWDGAASRLPEGGDVIDVYIKALAGCSHVSAPLGSRNEPVEMCVKIKTFALAIALTLGGCKRQPETVPSPGGQTAGAASPRQAVELFLAAVRAEDLQAMSFIWGTPKGPAVNSDMMTREEMEKREIIMICYLRHDKFRIGTESPGAGGMRILTVEITRTATNESRTTTFQTVPGAGTRSEACR